MRIRTTKPEFWRSKDISALEIEDRFLFIGIWSYVDDNGVGEDRVSTIAADLFADDIERDPSETFARVSRGLQALCDKGLIVRYIVDSRAYLRVTSWAAHQRIDRPNKPRFPFENGVIARVFDEADDDSRDTRESIATPSRLEGEGEGEQGKGNRGTGEGEVFTPPPPRYCNSHPNGTERPCRACMTRREAYERWEAVQAAKPKPVKPHVHTWMPDGSCLGCDEMKEAS